MNKNKLESDISALITLFVLVVGVALLVSFVSYPFIKMRGLDEGIKYMERQAVKEGLAEYRPDEEGNPTFIWKK